MPNQHLRIGHGYDLHRLEPIAPEGKGRPLIIGGVRFPSDRGPVGHSDADALAHAITDALLGAIGEPDIGQLFPDDNPRHESQDSAAFLTEAVRRVRQAGYELANLDATVILERPRINTRKHEIRTRLAAILGVDESQINVKGKSHEGVDATGRLEAIEAHAIALLTRP
ncbi:MAG: 2-C-methyl-D-erythritol 2,4-cyclodiphosphate synthase [Phycisphaerales bacterium]|nr:2-C-methyl-D-erythritol 2,4-cyclodiphosphate synthase [Phycisphaerales bacterium]